MTRDQGPLCPAMPVNGALSQEVYTAASHGASGQDTEEFPGPAGETGGCGQGGTEQHQRGILGESSVFVLFSSEALLWAVTPQHIPLEAL